MGKVAEPCPSGALLTPQSDFSLTVTAVIIYVTRKNSTYLVDNPSQPRVTALPKCAYATWRYLELRGRGSHSEEATAGVGRASRPEQNVLLMNQYRTDGYAAMLNDSYMKWDEQWRR